MIFQTKEEIDRYFSGDKIKCLICGREYKALATHLVRAHEIEPDDYRARFGLPFSRGLVASDTRALMATAMKERIDAGDGSLMPICLVASIGQQTKNRFQPFTRKEMGRRITKHNVEDKTTTREEMELFVDFFERANIHPWSIDGIENELGIITSCTFRRNKSKHKDLSERMDSILKDAPPRHAGFKQKRSAVQEIILSLRNSGLTTRAIAEHLKIGATTVKRSLNKDGAWK